MTQEQIDKFCRMVDNTWHQQRRFMATTRCTTCGQARRCITSSVDLTSTCKECYTKERLKEMETEERKAKIQTNLKDFAKL